MLGLNIVSQDKVVINRTDLEALLTRVLLINSKILEYKTTYAELGRELKLVESHLKTYQQWLDVELNQASK